MQPDTDQIHVMPLGDQWQVEGQSGIPLAHAPDRHNAISIARRIANEKEHLTILLHEADGVTQEISTSGEAEPQSPSQT